jgi:hypothetical protein
MRPAVRLPLVELDADSQKAAALAMATIGENDRVDRLETFARVARRG